MKTDSALSKIVETRCTLRRPKRQGNQPRLSPSGTVPLVDALQVRTKLPRITHTVARAILFEQAITKGEAADFADLARLTGTTRERVSQVMKMMWLAPDIQEEILRLPPARRGTFTVTVPEIAVIADAVMWAEQRELWQKLKDEKQSTQE
jgi:hypothetical protein